MRLALSLLLAWVALTVGVELTNEQEENMPDFGDPKVAKRLKCSACRASAVEMHDAMRSLRKKRGKAKIKEYEYTEVMDKVCEVDVKSYGIQLRNNLPTHKFSKDETISRAHGNWASRYVAGICSDMYQEHEEDLFTLQHAQILDFVSEVCHGVMKVCTSDDVIDDTLGDESSAGGEL